LTLTLRVDERKRMLQLAGRRAWRMVPHWTPLRRVCNVVRQMRRVFRHDSVITESSSVAVWRDPGGRWPRRGQGSPRQSKTDTESVTPCSEWLDYCNYIYNTLFSLAPVRGACQRARGAIPPLIRTTCRQLHTLNVCSQRARQLNWPQLNWPAASRPSYALAHWSRASASRLL